MDRRRKREGVYEVAKNTQDRRDEEDIPHDGAINAQLDRGNGQG